jgi:hypothetical protein
MMPSKARKMRFAILSGKVSAPLTNFPVYVEVTHSELGNLLDDEGKRVSFRQVNGTPLPYELQRFEKTAGRLQAWVLLPTIAPDGDTRFELYYGNEEIRIEPAPATVWAGYHAVFHLETMPMGASSIPNSAAAGSPGSPEPDLSDSDDLVNAKLGKGYDFNGSQNERFTFPNPIANDMPSTFSAWVNQRPTNNDDIVLQLGSNGVGTGRILYSHFQGTEVVAGDLSGDPARAVSIENQGWKLVHWTYQTVGGQGTGDIFLDGLTALAAPATYGAIAATANGGRAHVGGSDAAFGAGAAINGQLDEVRIAKTALSAAWMKAEFDNQSAPADFLTVEAPQDVP